MTTQTKDKITDASIEIDASEERVIFKQATAAVDEFGEFVDDSTIAIFDNETRHVIFYPWITVAGKYPADRREKVRMLFIVLAAIATRREPKDITVDPALLSIQIKGREPLRLWKEEGHKMKLHKNAHPLRPGDVVTWLPWLLPEQANLDVSW